MLSFTALRAVAAEPQANDAKPAPDMIIFTNGDQLTGTMERGVGDSVLFKSDMAGELTIPLAKIKELRVGGSFAVLRKHAPVTKSGVQPGTIQYADGAIKVSSSTGPVETVLVKDLAYIIDAPTYQNELISSPGFLHGWTGTATGGATVVQSTQTGSTYNVGIALVRAIPTVSYIPRRNRTIFDLSETYGKQTQPVIPQTTPASPDLVTKTNIFHTDIERDQYFSPKFYALADASFDHNYSQALNLQEIYGVGIGYTVLQTPIQQLDVKADIHYEKQYFQVSANDANLVGASIGENYLRNLPRKMIFTESAVIIPAFNNASAYSALLSAGLALPVYHRFSANFAVSDSFLNNPPAGYKKNSFQFVTGLAYTFH